MQYFIKRQRYLNDLIDTIDKDFIKIITGIRRCGKSKLMEQFKEYLEKNYKTAAIVFINFDVPENEKYLQRENLKKYIDSVIKNKQKVFLLLDEIQDVENFEQLILGYYQNKKIDIYLTGSNSHMLSKQIATKFTGRDLQINIWPFSYLEYLEFCKLNKYQADFNKYLDCGGMPSLLTIKDNPILFHNNAKSIISSILLRDLIPFFNIKNSVLLEKLIGYIFSNIGNMFSANNIKEYFINNKIYKTISQNTVEKYLNYLVDGFILCKCLRYDIRGKKKLKTLYKMYVTDTGLKNSYLEQRTYTNIGDNIENVVYIELLRRGYSVYYGTFQYKDNVKKTTVIKEIDFVCINNEEIWYIQVADNISSQSVMERELSPFSSIKDGYKLLLNNSGVNTMIDGVKIMDVQKWLLEKTK